MLEVKDLHAYYGKSHIIQGISFSVEEGEIVSLLGRNGVGRSTSIKAIMGEIEHTGSIQFKGEEISGLPPHEIARRGLGYVPENRDIFPTMTTLQNLLLGEKKRKQTGRWSLEDMYKMFPNLGERSHVLGGMISGGEQQMLTICRTLMGDPDLIMIDEPTEGLAPKLVEQVADLLKEIASRGLSILLIEQKLVIAMEISKRVIVMGHGQLVFEGTPDELRTNDKIRQEWLEV
jgi:branched-chain amino acid transport system ATP-binding protein